MGKKQAVSPINGQPVPKGKPFTTGDSRAKEAQILSTKSKNEKADLKKMMQLWLETDVAKDKDGNVLTGAEYMVQIAAKEMKKGNSKFWELMRDTAGFKPVEKHMISEVEQSVIDEVESMVNEVNDGTKNEG